MENLVASLTLLDDDGTVVFNLTTEDDYRHGFKKKFRAPHVQNYEHFNTSKVTRHIDEFISVQLSPFFHFAYFLQLLLNHSSVVFIY